MPYTATAKEYRRRAEGVRAAAEKIPAGAAREALLELASQWDQLAEYKTDREGSAGSQYRRFKPRKRMVIRPKS
jgi:hypothetical protein